MRILERTAWSAGLLLLVFVVLARVAGEHGRLASLDAFAADRDEVAGLAPATVPALSSLAQPDRSLWSQFRLDSFEQSQLVDVGQPLAVLSIPGLELRVPVYDGTGDIALNRGAGRIKGTALPGKGGNLGIAGHRDGYFRVLKNIRRGDLIVIEVPGRTLEYRVAATEVVAPSDLRLLADTDEPVVTLVTCYPFYFVGNAPQRFIARGVFERSQAMTIPRTTRRIP